MSTGTEQKDLGLIINALGKNKLPKEWGGAIADHFAENPRFADDIATASKLEEYTKLFGQLAGSSTADEAVNALAVICKADGEKTTPKDLYETFGDPRRESTEQPQAQPPQPPAHEIPYDDSADQTPADDPRVTDYEIAGLHTESPVTVYPDWRGDVLDTTTGIRYAVSFREGGTWEMALRQIKQFRLLHQEGQRFGITISQYKPEDKAGGNKPAQTSANGHEQPAKPKGESTSDTTERGHNVVGIKLVKAVSKAGKDYQYYQPYIKRQNTQTGKESIEEFGRIFANSPIADTMRKIVSEQTRHNEEMTMLPTDERFRVYYTLEVVDGKNISTITRIEASS